MRTQLKNPFGDAHKFKEILLSHPSLPIKSYTLCPSRFLYIYSFIYLFFVLLCELTGRLVAMGHVLVCEIKNKLS